MIDLLIFAVFVCKVYFSFEKIKTASFNGRFFEPSSLILFYSAGNWVKSPIREIHENMRFVNVEMYWGI